jgi:ELWxxDGT repeat protein
MNLNDIFAIILFKIYINMKNLFLFWCFLLISICSSAQNPLVVKDIYEGTISGLSDNSNDHFELNGKLIFVADDGTTGLELWTSDGTEEGTILVKDIRPQQVGPNFGSDIRSMRRVGDYLLFYANDGEHGTELWRTDGTEEGTILLKDINPEASGYSNENRSVRVIDDIYYFVANSSSTGLGELWRSDGTEEGTYFLADPLTDVSVSSDRLSSLIEFGGDLYFYARDNGLWKSDGTQTGTIQVIAEDDLPFAFTDIYAGENYFYSSNIIDGVHHTYRTDGTLEETIQILEVETTALTFEIPRVFPSHEGHTWFIADENLYRTDDTAAGTQLVELTNELEDFLYHWGANGMFVFNGDLFFHMKKDESGTQERGLFKRIGDEIVYISRTPSTSNGEFTYIPTEDGRFFFNARLDGAGEELMSTTGQVGNLTLHESSQNNLNASIERLTLIDNTLFFSAIGNGLGRELNKLEFEPLIQISVSTAQTNVSCFGGNNGQINIEATSGTPPFSIEWDSGISGFNPQNLESGNYSFTVTDAEDVSFSQTITITEPDALEINTSDLINIDCNGNSNGQISTEVSGGTQAYFFAWSEGSDTETITNLGVGEYSLSVTDANGCTTTESFTITEPAILEVTNSEITDVDCNGEATGQISTEISGGTEDYTFDWSEGGSDTGTITGLSAGEYSLSVTDANGCTTTENFMLTEPSAIQSEIITTASNSSLNNGTAELTTEGGVSPYSYQWSHSNAETTNTATGLSAGDYTVTITDTNNCETIIDFTIDNINSLTEQEEEEYFSIYPNPTPASFRIKLHSEVSSSDIVYIYNSLGQLEYSVSAQESPRSYRLPAGVYNIVLQKDKKTYSKRIIVTR